MTDQQTERTSRIYEDAALTSMILAFGLGISLGALATLFTIAMGLAAGFDIIYPAGGLFIGAIIALGMVYWIYRNPEPIFEAIWEVQNDAE